MALDQRKWQKKVERKKKKQQKRKRSLIQFQSLSMADRIEHTATAPILHCQTTKSLWINGMANVLVSRKLSNGNVALSVFLLDVYCLGVKDAYCDIVTPARYEEILDRQFGEHVIERLRPEAARKLVEGAVAYSQDLGFSPHSDYNKAKLIFGDIDASGCADEFEYGDDGKPHFIAGPHDQPWRCRRIMNTLNERLGAPHKFHFTIPLEPSGGLEFFDDDGDEEIDDDEVDDNIIDEAPRLSNYDNRP